MVTVFSTYHLNKALSVRDYLKAQGINAEIGRTGVSHLVLCTEDEAFKARRLLAQIESHEDYAQKVMGASWEQESSDRGSTPIVWPNVIQHFKQVKFTGAILLCCALVFGLQLIFDGGNPKLIFDALSFDSVAIISGFEIWRVLTPAIMHGSWLHIIFNLVMFNFLATPLELRLGWGRLLTIVVASAAIGNIFQYYIGGRVGNFYGLSGVVYGLTGYLAVMSRRPDLAHGLRIIPGLFLVSLLFLVISFLFMSDIASYCHLGGLLAGLAVGAIDLIKFAQNKSA